MREGDKVVLVETDWWSAFGKKWVLERGQRLTISHRFNLNGTAFYAFEELDEDPDGDPPMFMASGFRPAVLN